MTDSKAVSDLVDNIIKSDDMITTATTSTIGKLFGDGAYQINEIFGYLRESGSPLFNK